MWGVGGWGGVGGGWGGGGGVLGGGCQRPVGNSPWTAAHGRPVRSPLAVSCTVSDRSRFVGRRGHAGHTATLIAPRLPARRVERRGGTGGSVGRQGRGTTVLPAIGPPGGSASL